MPHHQHIEAGIIHIWALCYPLYQCDLFHLGELSPCSMILYIGPLTEPDFIGGT